MDMGDFAITLTADPAGRITRLGDGGACIASGDRLCCRWGHRIRGITLERQGDEGLILHLVTRWGGYWGNHR